jgi:hypothetical protein
MKMGCPRVATTRSCNRALDDQGVDFVRTADLHIQAKFSKFGVPYRTILARMPTDKLRFIIHKKPYQLGVGVMEIEEAIEVGLNVEAPIYVKQGRCIENPWNILKTHNYFIHKKKNEKTIVICRWERWREALMERFSSYYESEEAARSEREAAHHEGSVREVRNSPMVSTPIQSPLCIGELPGEGEASAIYVCREGGNMRRMGRGSQNNED